jgi:HEAT repeat protein
MEKNFAAELQKIIDSATSESRKRVTGYIESLRAAGIDSFETAEAAVKDASLSRKTRQTACWLLGQLRRKRAVASLLSAFADPWLTWEAAKALGVTNSKRAVKPLVSTLLEPGETEQRAAAAYALGLLADERSRDPLVKVLSDPKVDPKVRGHAAEALAHLADERAADQLVAALKDRSVEVRFWSVFALGQLKYKRALQQLKRILANDKATLSGWGKISDAARDAIASIEVKK